MDTETQSGTSLTQRELHKGERTEPISGLSNVIRSELQKEKQPPVEPFLRWAGGKRWLARRIGSVFPDFQFERYHEPFLGGGSIFFAIASGRSAVLSDQNKDLVSTYSQLKADPEGVIDILRGYENTEEFYYRVRSYSPNSNAEVAARFLYLNQTSFNGIYRVNLRGEYNVPYGHRSKVFLDESNLRAASKALSEATLVCRDFEDCLNDISCNDFVFLDPPYTVSHNKNGFIKYNEKLFSLDDQYRLARFVEGILEIGAKFVLTNAAHEKVAKIFSCAGKPIELQRANLIGGKKAERGAISEFVFTNLEVKT